MGENRINQQGSILEHLLELRKRLVICFVAIALGFFLSYYFKEELMRVITLPLIRALPSDAAQHLIYTAPQEAFLVYLKMSFIAGCFIAVPVIIYQFWKFVAPGLYEHEKKYIYPIIIACVVCFMGGASFGYFVALPFGFQFLMSFTTGFLSPMISTKEFLSFAVKLLMAFGLIFELPVVVFFLARLGLIDSDFLSRQRRVAIVIIFVVAAILTPPDAFSQIIMAIPLLILYEISVWITKIWGPKKRGESEQEKAESAMLQK